MHRVMSPVSAHVTARTWWWRELSANTSNLARRGNTVSIITSTAPMLWPSTSTSTERQVTQRLVFAISMLINTLLCLQVFLTLRYEDIQVWWIHIYWYWEEYLKEVDSEMSPFLQTLTKTYLFSSGPWQEAASLPQVLHDTSRRI